MPHRLKPSRGKQKIPLELILEYYDAWLRTDNVLEVCKVMNVRRQNLNLWPEKYPEMKMAKEMADKRRVQGQGSLQDYIYKRLSDEGKAAWDELQWHGRHATTNQMKKFLDPLTKEVKQELFLHALVTNHFDTSTACSIVGISMSGLQWWRENDEKFAKIFKEMFEHRNNFYEKQLVSLVEMGNPGAVIFVNETVNADRGYSKKLKVEHSGAVDTGFNFDELDLDIDTRRKILEAMRRKKLANAPKQLAQAIVDVEEAKE